MNGLNDEPGCRWPLVARLNGLRRKSVPPTIAFTSPVLLSITTIDELGPPYQRFCEIAFCAACCIAGSIVVVTFRPPPNTLPAPKRSTSCWVTHVVKYGWLESGCGRAMSCCDGIACTAAWLYSAWLIIFCESMLRSTWLRLLRASWGFWIGS